MNSPHVPYAEGFSAAPTLDARGMLPKYELRTGVADSLHSMLDDYAFFCPAPLYLRGFFRDSVLVDLMHERRTNIPLFWKKFNRPVFKGLTTPDGDVDWNYVLWAVRAEHMQMVRDFLVSVSLFCREDGTYVGYAEQEFTIPDPLYLDTRLVVSADKVPLLPVVCFGVNSSTARHAFECRGSVFLSPPTLRRFPPDPKIVRMAAALRGDKNPHTEKPDADHN
jgi:hypothetical protein